MKVGTIPTMTACGYPLSCFPWFWAVDLGVVTRNSHAQTTGSTQQPDAPGADPLGYGGSPNRLGCGWSIVKMDGVWMGYVSSFLVLPE